MITVNLKQDLKHLYTASAKQPKIVDVPPLHFLMVDGSGDPTGSQSFDDALGALYAVAYKLRFSLKARGIDSPVMPTEGLWWAQNMGVFQLDDRANWLWTMMIPLPDVVTPADVEQAVSDVRRKKNPPALDRLRFETYHEGLAVQIMHVGSYDEEAPTIDHLHRFIDEQGYDLTGKHHEIYIGDPNRTAPQNLKTIIRQPVAPKS